MDGCLGCLGSLLACLCGLESSAFFFAFSPLLGWHVIVKGREGKEEGVVCVYIIIDCTRLSVRILSLYGITVYSLFATPFSNSVDIYVYTNAHDLSTIGLFIVPSSHRTSPHRNATENQIETIIMGDGHCQTCSCTTCDKCSCCSH